MKNNVLFVLLDKYAEWEAAPLAAALNSGVTPLGDTRYTTATVAPTSDAVRSIGGFRTMPDYHFDSMPQDYAALVLVGGMSWDKPEAGCVEELVARALREEELKYKTAFMLFVAKEYHRLGWAMQLHYGCKRDNNAYMFQQLGPDTGFDCINNYAPSAQMADFLNALSATNEIPKTIIYSLNPNDDASIGTILGCFQDPSAEGKLQQGSAWWFNDHKQGMTAQMTSLANLGCLGNFIGMLTDSRSFLSYTRHEYFRRIMCELLGGWVENGEYPDDQKALKKIVEGICYNNAVKYFGFNL